MNNLDIIQTICQHLYDADIFKFLSVTKTFDAIKGKLFFYDPVHLYLIYFHRYFHQFTNIIVCDKVSKITLPNGVVIRKKKPRFPKAMKKIEFQTSVNYLYQDLFGEGITHIKFYKGQCIETFYHKKRSKSILPTTLTHLVSATWHYNKINVELSPLLQYLDWNKNLSAENTTNLQNLKHISNSSPERVPDIVSLKCCIADYSLFPVTLRILNLSCAEFNNKRILFGHLINVKYLNLCRTNSISYIEFPPNITHYKTDSSRNIFELPNTLIYLNVHNVYTIHNNINIIGPKHIFLNSLPELPNLTYLNIYREFTFIKYYFPQLQYLECNYFKEPCEIPSSVRHLVIGNYLGNTKWYVPDSVTHLSLHDNERSVLYKKPLIISNIIKSPSITYLDISEITINIDPILLENITQLIVNPKYYAQNKKMLSLLNVEITIKRDYDDPFMTSWDSQNDCTYW